MTEPTPPTAPPPSATPPAARGPPSLASAGPRRRGLRSDHGAGPSARLLALVLGFAVATQVQQTPGRRARSSCARTTWSGILDDVTSGRAPRPAGRASSQVTRDAPDAAAPTRSRRRSTQAQQQADTLGILAGTGPGQGPGIEVTITDPDEQGHRGDRCSTPLQELRDAGAEAIQIDDDPGRRRAPRSPTSERRIQVDGQAADARRYVIDAIGDSATHGLGAWTSPAASSRRSAAPTRRARSSSATTVEHRPRCRRRERLSTLSPSRAGYARGS